MTGYQAQWSRAGKWVPPGRPRDLVLFSWMEAPAGVVFVEYDFWHLVLNAVRAEGGDPHRLFVELEGRRDESSILCRSWRSSDWLRYARRYPHSVQAVVPQLDLRTADQVWAPSQRVARALGRLGFTGDRVCVRRLLVGDS